MYFKWGKNAEQKNEHTRKRAKLRQKRKSWIKIDEKKEKQ